MIYFIILGFVLFVVGIVLLTFDYEDLGAILLFGVILCLLLTVVTGSLVDKYATESTYAVKYNGFLTKVAESNTHLKVIQRRNYLTLKKDIIEYRLYDMGEQVLSTTNKDKVINWFNPKKDSDIFWEN